MRAIVNNPIYRCLKTTAERKNAFMKFLDKRKDIDKVTRNIHPLKELTRELEDKLRIDFINLLKNCDKIDTSVRWR